MAAKSYFLPSVPNFRDVAELVPGLRDGVLYRSDLVWEPAAECAKTIASCGLGTVFDLRSPRERSHRPNRWFAEAGARIMPFDVNQHSDPLRLAQEMGAARDSNASHRMMLAAYAEFPAGALPALRALGETLATNSEPVLVHCAAGKDRTGFVIAALLLGVGLSWEAVVADYLASAGRMHTRTLAEANASLGNTFGGLSEDALATIRGTSPDFLRSAIHAAEQSHGTIAGYLASAGVDAAQMAQLRRRLFA
jgi:protein-tyrosine phosphatase